MSYETRYAAKKRAEEELRADSLEVVAWRIRNAEILEQVKEEMRARWPVFTPANFEEANAYREARVKELHEMTEATMRTSTIRDAESGGETYFKGNRARFTGKTEVLHGGLFGQAVLLEGHEKGKTVDIAIAEAATPTEKSDGGREPTRARGPAAPDYAADIPLDTAVAAHSGTSHVPGRRGEQERAEYASTLANDLANLERHADTPEKREDLEEMFGVYRAGYRRRFLAHLQSRARCVSSMITGPSNFPTRRNEKSNATADKRLTDLLEFRKESLTRIEKALHPERRPVMSGDDDAEERLAQKIAAAERLQETMKASNAAIRRNAKHGPEAQLAALKNIGHPEARARALLEPDFCGKVGFPSYALTNNNANIRRMKARLEKVRADKAAEDSVEEGKAATVEDCPADNRVRLQFPGKPAAEVRRKLKSLGFRWAPSTGCWQAYRNHRSLEAAREIARVAVDETEGRKP